MIPSNKTIPNTSNKTTNNSFKKTGTTIVGLTYKNGIILLADTRATNGPIVAQKNIRKLHKVSENIYCAGAGTAADTDRINIYAQNKLNIFHQKFSQLPPIPYYVNIIQTRLFEHQGYIGAALIAGGIDEEGKHLYSFSPNGYMKKEVFCTLGSGSLAALGILESGYKKDMDEADALNLGIESIKAGILNDLYSGSNVNYVIISEDPNEEDGFKVRKGDLEVVSSPIVKKFDVPKCGIIEKESIWKYVEEYE